MNEITQIDAFRSILTKMTTEIKAALPVQISPEKFIRTTLTAVGMQPDLLQTDRRTLLASCMRCAQDGLLPDGREAAFVIFNGKTGKTCTYMPMVGGILKKIRNSGELASISAHVVYDADTFEYELGDFERILHKPYLGTDRGKVIACYAIAKTKDGAIYREVMSVAEVEKVRSSSKAKSFGPWVDWWDEMAKKTVIRRLAKRLPSSADVDQVIESDNELYEVQSASQTPAQSRLKQAILPTANTPDQSTTEEESFENFEEMSAPVLEDK